ncbi:hypothetical protein JKP88DRAFT_262098 [Tribonema minus]|uniref:RRM domain-containing protein n=1 Tax=Tribonema minus TaxID=303371 RepID=A0A835Z9Z3_9STRA|nr:hypothetical protein JKP88DRAFT_262098 [Tribonema minus]
MDDRDAGSRRKRTATDDGDGDGDYIADQDNKRTRGDHAREGGDLWVGVGCSCGSLGTNPGSYWVLSNGDVVMGSNGGGGGGGDGGSGGAYWWHEGLLVGVAGLSRDLADATSLTDPGVDVNLKSVKHCYVMTACRKADDASTTSGIGDLAAFTHFVRLRGLPWNATVKDVTDFLRGIEISDEQVYIVHNTRGEAYVKLHSEASQEACIKCDRKTMGRRYIEVFPASAEDIEASLNVEQPKSSENGAVEGVLRMRGLPWTATEEDILSFFSGFDVRAGGVHIAKNREGRPSGEAYVVFHSELDAHEAKQQRDKEKMGGRWIDLFESTKGEMYANTGRSAEERWSEAGGERGAKDLDYRGVLKMRGLPFDATKAQIIDFFHGYGVEDSEVFIVMGRDGRPTGDAFVIFKDETDAKSALNLDKEKLGGRWVDLFPSTKAAVYERVGPTSVEMASRPDASYRGVLRMRGLPYSAGPAQIRDFFGDYAISKSDGIHVITGPDGRPSGEAYVEFANEDDAKHALGLHKEKIGDRYIELFQVTKGDLYTATTRPSYQPTHASATHVLARTMGYRGTGGGGGAVAGGYSGGYGGFSGGGGGGYRGGGGGYGGGAGGRGGGMHALPPPAFGGSAGGTYPANGPPPTCAKLRGLPYQVTEQDIFDFFNGLDVIGIFICKDASGRPTGEGFVEFGTIQHCAQGLNRNRHYMLERYIEVFACTKDDVLQEISGQGRVRLPPTRPVRSAGAGGGGGGYPPSGGSQFGGGGGSGGYAQGGFGGGGRPSGYAQMAAFSGPGGNFNMGYAPERRDYPPRRGGGGGGGGMRYR